VRGERSLSLRYESVRRRRGLPEDWGRPVGPLLLQRRRGLPGGADVLPDAARLQGRGDRRRELRRVWSRLSAELRLSKRHVRVYGLRTVQRRWYRRLHGGPLRVRGHDLLAGPAVPRRQCLRV